MFAKLRGWQRVMLWLVMLKIGYFALVGGLISLCPDFDENRNNAVLEYWFPNSEARWLATQQTKISRHFTTWDASHYLVLSEAGYFKGLKSCAFYPLWPLTVLWVSDATGVSRLIAGMVLANLFSLAGWTLFWSITAKRFGASVAKWALAFLVVFPGSVFYQFIYTEPLFFLLVMLLWFGMESRCYGLACMAAFLLPLSRAVGVFALLPILWHMLKRWRAAARAPGNAAPRQGGIVPVEGRRADIEEFSSAKPHEPGSAGMPAGVSRAEDLTDRDASAPKRGTSAREIRLLTSLQLAGPMLLVAAPLLGWAAYFGLMRHWTGNAFEGFQGQANWHAHSINNLWDLPKFVIGFLEPASWHEFRGSVLDRCGFMLLASCLPLVWHMGKDLVVWVCVLGIVPAMSGTFISFIRFESVVFPLFIALAVLTVNLGGRWLRLVAIHVMVILHVILLWRFLNYGWAG